MPPNLARADPLRQAALPARRAAVLIFRRVGKPSCLHGRLSSMLGVTSALRHRANR